MPVKIRLSRKGRRKKPYYHIVVADVRAPRDGKFIEQIGSYNPMTKPATIEIDRQKAFDWLMNGAQPTDTVRAILRFKGVMYKKHLQRGVAKGAMTQEAADTKLQEWIDAKEAKVAARREETAKERAAFLKMVSGEAKAVKKEVVDEAAAEAFREPDATEAAPAEEAAPATEVEEAKEEAPVAVAAPVTEAAAEVAGALDTPAEKATEQE